MEPLADNFAGNDRARVMRPEDVKGLEFDLVVLIDPDSFGEGVTGGVDRCVSMTRTTNQLVLLHGRPPASVNGV